jgi:hypothetical protein
MKSTEVYKIIRDTVGPWCKQQGFRRTSGGMLGWHRPEGAEHLVFWFQCSQDGWDAYAGSKFIVEFQVSDSSQIGVGTRRYRLPYFLTEHELNQVRSIQNAVIARLPTPPRDYYIFGLDRNLVDWYQAKFRTVQEPYSSRDDIWLRYHEPADVRRWAEFLLSVLPRVVSEAGGAD